MRRAIPLLFLGPLLHAATYYVTVAGLGGEPEYVQRFAAWAGDLDKILKAGGPEAHVATLKGDQATRANLQTALEDVAKQAKPDDALVVMLIGHGSFDGYEYKLELPGPDITAGELAALLDRIPAGRQLVVNTTSASGGSLAALEKPNRAVITATKSGTERNATIFARYWVAALQDPTADTDKNETISALEAFRYAQEKTANFYETQNRLATEHPVLEDTGQGEAVKTPSPENGKGLLAARISLLQTSAAQAVAKDPAKQALLKKKEELDQQIDTLKYQKAAMPLEEYRKQLSALLLELAKTQEELDKK
ncbi:MAG: hypothetical protein ACRD9L_03335 [Bryobacteraceae bacterium]